MDFEKKLIFYYNPVAEAESSEIGSIRLAMCSFIALCSNTPETDVIKQWRSETVKHASQTDSFNCGVYCLMFAEYHLNGRFQEMEGINSHDLSVMRLSVAKKFMSFKEFLLDSCPTCGFTVLETDVKTNTGRLQGQAPNSYKWVDKQTTLEDLRKVERVEKDVFVSEKATDSLPPSNVNTDVTVNRKGLKHTGVYELKSVRM
ncbi:hypothetical protein DPMN_158718 [Dreissena polymorpha]|uniref:Ubiquitin-like protease family profile domain-containing protein n=1 Tax=Dreissena polymorpha TaxID=45954 RepID=A0A9D4EJM1_DREPO|nr:hypothetical protein DPMN_158718 [Dreissena polymorpha]